MEVSSDRLVYGVPHSGIQAQTIVITNTNKSKPLVYKVKTTKPKLFTVHPNASTVEPGSKLQVTISRNGENGSESDLQGAGTKDKFLILGALVSEAEATEPSTDLWKRLESAKSDLISHRVNVVYEHEGQQGQQGTPGSSSAHGHHAGEAGVAGTAGVGAAGAGAAASSHRRSPSDEANYTAHGSIDGAQGVPHRSHLVDQGDARNGPVLGPKPDYDPSPKTKAEGPGKESATREATYNSYADSSKDAAPASSYASSAAESTSNAASSISGAAVGATAAAGAAVGGAAAAVTSLFSGKKDTASSGASVNSGNSSYSAHPGATGPSIHDAGDNIGAGFGGDSSYYTGTPTSAGGSAGTTSGSAAGSGSGFDHSKLAGQVKQGGNTAEQQIGKSGANIGGVDSKTLGAGAAGAGAAGAAGIGYYDKQKNAGSQGSKGTHGSSQGTHTGAKSEAGQGTHAGNKSSQTHTGAKSEAGSGFDSKQLSGQLKQGGTTAQEQIGKSGASVGGVDSNTLGAGAAGAGAAGAAGVDYYGKHQGGKETSTQSGTHTGGKSESGVADASQGAAGPVSGAGLDAEKKGASVHSGVQHSHHSQVAELPTAGVPVPAVFIIALIAFIFGWKFF